MDENEILTRIQCCLNGEQESFTPIIQRYQQSIYHLGFHFLGNRQDAEDASVEIFFKVYRTLRSYNRRWRFSTWLFKIAYHHLVDMTRRKNRERQYFSTEIPFFSELMVEETPGQVFFKNREKEELKKGLQSISPARRTALLLRYHHQLCYRDISRILGVPVNTVASLISRGKRELREKIGGEEK